MKRKPRISRADRYERASLRLIDVLEHGPQSQRPQAKDFLESARRCLEAFRTDPALELQAEIANPTAQS